MPELWMTLIQMMQILSRQNRGGDFQQLWRWSSSTSGGLSALLVFMVLLKISSNHSQHLECCPPGPHGKGGVEEF
eukprot:6723727-Ditylum_brightwellii.AAC.1